LHKPFFYGQELSGQKLISPLFRLTFCQSWGARFAGKTVGIVQFENIPGSEEKARLAASGIELLDYLPDNAYTVAFRGVPSAIVLQQAGARASFN
jgi:hypothetical protein